MDVPPGPRAHLERLALALPWTPPLAPVRTWDAFPSH